MESFKLKLAAYFSLISLLPLTAAFWGFDAVTERAETDRADSVLQVGLRSALATYQDELRRLEESAADVARDRAFQRALRARDERAVRRALRGSPNLRVEAGPLEVGAAAPLAAELPVEVEGAEGRLGRVIASLPVDSRLTDRLERSSGLEGEHQLVFISANRVLAGDAATRGPVDVAVGEPKTATLGSKRQRVLASAPLPAPKGVRLAILTPQSRIDAAVRSAEGRVFVPLLIALVLIALLAYIEGRSIVRTLRALVDAARGIAQGKLDERVPVRGRDEFAQLGRAFNEMADQLQARLSELDAERTRVRDATMRFGEALAATHDIDQLLRVIVESAVESTGASQGQIVDDDRVLIEVGDKRGPAQLEFPLSAGRETFGSLLLHGENFTSEQRESAGWLVGHAVIALANAQRHQTVEQQALVDSLTGLANRRLCTAALEKELARAERFGEPLALVLTDIDDFKDINDRWGHPTGDEVLKAFAKTLQASVREIDLAGRWGGEEFALLLPGTDLNGGHDLAERVRRKLVRKKFLAPNGERIRVTASFGVAAFPEARTQDQLVAASDGALYEAKRSGKNKVAVAESFVTKQAHG